MFQIPVPSYRVTIQFTNIGKRVFDFHSLQTAKETVLHHSRRYQCKLRKLTKREIATAERRRMLKGS